MSISGKTRKTLWGKSGNRCAICKEELVGYRKGLSGDVIIGEECHIVSSKPLGPRYDANLKISFDDYDNLILLCRNHHKVIDEQIGVYTVGQLMLTKIMHESWVKETLDKILHGKTGETDKLQRITSGKELVAIIDSVHGYSFEHDEVETESEASAVAVFFENMEDYGDLMGMGSIDKGAQVQLGLDFKKHLQELESLGFWVFGERRKQAMQDGDGKSLGRWDLAILHVIRNSNSNIIKQ
jgi:predicted restriction endonuclease